MRTGDPAAGTAERAALIAVRDEVAKAVVGQDQVLSGLLVALLCQGHVLLEGVPGVAKTLLVRALAAALALDSKRVQFTPDLMPGDVTGSLVYDARTAQFEFREGPVFTNLLLADEINRTPPKTQAALLEAMEERQVSVEGVPRAAARPVPRRRDPEPGRVRGHLPAARGPAGPVLAEARRGGAGPGRRDRHPDQARGRIRSAGPRRRPASGRWPAPADLAAARAAVGRVAVSDEVTGYIVDICRGTRHVGRRSSSASRRAAAPRCSRRAGPGPGWPGATT